MTAKKTGQDQDNTSENAADVSPGGANQTAGPAAAAPSQTGPAATPVTPSPGAPATDAAAAPGDVTGTPELPGYLVTEVSSVLHDGTWYHQGDEIFLSDKEANPLLRRRIIEPSWSKK